jgi:hypothetical protein
MCTVRMLHDLRCISKVTDEAPLLLCKHESCHMRATLRVQRQAGLLQPQRRGVLHVEPQLPLASAQSQQRSQIDSAHAILNTPALRRYSSTACVLRPHAFGALHHDDK